MFTFADVDLLLNTGSREHEEIGQMLTEYLFDLLLVLVLDARLTIYVVEDEWDRVIEYCFVLAGEHHVIPAHGFWIQARFGLREDENKCLFEQKMHWIKLNGINENTENT